MSGVDPREDEHLWLRDLRRHPHGEVRLYVGSRLVSGTHAASITESIDRMLDTAAAAQDTADPADGLSEVERRPKRPNRMLAALETGEQRQARRNATAARQRPTRQADTDRAVVEAVAALADEIDAMADRQSKAHNVDGSVGIRWAADTLRATIAGANEPTSGHHEDGAGT